jgi:hypothetical protein
MRATVVQEQEIQAVGERLPAEVDEELAVLRVQIGTFSQEALTSKKAQMGQNQTILPLGIRLAPPAPTRYVGVALFPLLALELVGLSIIKREAK